MGLYAVDYASPIIHRFVNEVNRVVNTPAIKYKTPGEGAARAQLREKHQRETSRSMFTFPKPLRSRQVKRCLARGDTKQGQAPNSVWNSYLHSQGRQRG